MVKTAVKPVRFKDLVERAGEKIVPFRERDVVSVTVIQVTNHWIVVDVMGISEGYIPKKEFSTNSEKLKAGEVIEASIMVFEDDAGRMVLSLRRADREKYLTTLREKFESKASFEAKVVDANKGGLIIEVGGIQGFLPVSQLSAAHYPRVEGGDKQRILEKLKAFVGSMLLVRVITFESQAGKIIFSEKAAISEEQEELLKEVKIGSTHQATITGLADFGLFVTLENGLEGLVHIREVSWEPVPELRTKFTIGEVIKVKVLQVQGGKLSFSIKRLTKDPYEAELKAMKAGEVVSGALTRFTPVGGYLVLPSGAEVHVTLDEGARPSGLSVGDTLRLVVEEVDVAEHRLKGRLATDTTEKKPRPKRAKKTETKEDNGSKTRRRKS